MSWKRRSAFGCLTVILAFIAYRVIYIYRWRAGDCETGPQPRVMSRVYPHHLVVMTYNIEGDAELFKGAHHIGEIAKVMQSPEMKKQLLAQGVEARVSTPEQFGALIKNETAKWGKIIADAGIKE